MSQCIVFDNFCTPLFKTFVDEDFARKLNVVLSNSRKWSVFKMKRVLYNATYVIYEIGIAIVVYSRNRNDKINRAKTNREPCRKVCLFTYIRTYCMHSFKYNGIIYLNWCNGNFEIFPRVTCFINLCPSFLNKMGYGYRKFQEILISHTELDKNFHIDTAMRK